MKVDLYNFKSGKTGTTDLPDEIFGVSWNSSLVRQVLDSQRATKRNAWAHAKDRSEVSGGGRKPWRQKGTGRARHGSTRSPIWRTGGKAHGPLSSRNYTKKVNKKMRRAAVASVLSRKLRNDKLKVFESLSLEAPKTKHADQALRGVLGMGPRAKKFDVLLVPARGSQRDLIRASRNLGKTKVCLSASLNVEDLLTYKYLCLDVKSIPELSK